MMWVVCLDSGARFGYESSKTPYQALTAALYSLNLKHYDPAAVINKTESGRHLYFDHSGETWSIRNE